MKNHFSGPAEISPVGGLNRFNPRAMVKMLGLLALLGGGLTPAGFAQQSPAESRIPKAAAVDDGKNASAPNNVAVGISSSAPLVPADVIQIGIYQEPDLGTRVRIADDGTVLLPLIGAVKVGGRNLKEATEAVTALYKKDYLVNPEVSISLVEHVEGKERVGRLNILGQVARPGTVEIAADKGTPIIDVIALAGGFTRLARESKITVTRSMNGQQKVFKVNGKDQTSSEAKVFLVFPGDTIYVSESWF
jgi:protein involved in polysaccharide export with SLBB domain